MQTFSFSTVGPRGCRLTTSRACRARQSGLTLVELMIALVIGLVVALAAMAALIMARQGFTSVDASAQLRENARFAGSVLQRIIIESGFSDPVANGFGAAAPGLRGFDNSVVGLLTALPGNLAHDTRTAACAGIADTSCANGDDVLVVRFRGGGRTPTAADGSMINCAGRPEPNVSTATAGDPRAINIFHVARSTLGEPTLACTYFDPSSGYTTVPLVQGIEGFQVLYGVDGVAENVDAGPFVQTIPPATPPVSNDSVPDRYLTARQMDNGGAFSTNNWSRVRSVRIGLVVRGEVGSALQRSTATFKVLGDGFSATAASGKDPGAQLSVVADGRLRQVLVLTIHLRNPQF